MTDIEQYRAMLGGKYGEQEIVDDSIASNEYKKDDSRWSGIVVNNEDPNKLGRCQIRVIGYYENIADSFLPWAVPDIGYMGATKGGQIIPEKNAMVRGYFEKGDVQRPVYDSLAFNAYNAESDFSNRDIDYPYKMVLMETDQGDFLTLNRKDGTLLFTHRTGVMYQIDKDGNIDVQTGTQGGGNYTIKINGKANVDVTGDVNLKSNGNVDVQCGPAGQITMGNNPAKQNVNNIPNCFICGALHAVGNTQVKV